MFPSRLSTMEGIALLFFVAWLAFAGATRNVRSKRVDMVEETLFYVTCAALGACVYKAMV